ncbi:simple sugar transport system permease protein [Pseudomonas cuatrocienegasensis]|uniref:Simple sugar transport system permease protein n=1 Tax=Pseudomonas cuatrocienegasensis TaxID=543360 RepID=A0ABY1B6F5_9PSED|nr:MULTISPECIES: ABC transporter permease [Pseudomonas]OEC36810.1 ABC transporter permease [Pseudomonas sp. 21C1]SEQ07265.1 simple sugar transport system permease protein [Pseudomonas cuatrocienegasensis]
MELITSWLGNVPDFAVPYALAALGLILTERAGVLALGAEGLLLAGALASIGMQLALGVTGLSLLAGMAAAALVSVLFAVMVIILRINQVIAGLTLVFFCQGLTSLLGTLLEWTNQPIQGLPALALWPLSELPLIGRLFNQNLMVYLTAPIFFAVVWYLQRSTSGLRLRAVGENPQAADAAGIPVIAYRFAAVMAGAALVGLAGAYIAVLSTKMWIADMSGGRGWIAVALVIFARWSPWKALVGALLFGCIEALIPQLAAAGIRLPQYFVLMTPYAVTLGVMIWVALSGRGQNDQPGALGEPYVREERR